MLDITERQKEILEKLVQEYIKTAIPISSGFLKQECGLEISPATIRLDFAELTQTGFLEKGYISGGRVPTDKGYRFFVDNLFEKENFELTEKNIFEDFELISKQISDVLRFSQEVAKNLACFSSNLGVVFVQDFGIFWKEGWEEILQVPEFHNLDYLRKFTELVNALEENIDKLDFVNQDKEIKIYIGKESPFKRKEFSIIIGHSSRAKNKPTFAILGPKRMDFKKNISLINCLLKHG